MQASIDSSETALDGGLLDDALLQIPSGFGRLLCMASLVISQSEGTDAQQGTPEWRVLCVHHLAVFEEWLMLSLQEKLADIEWCAACQGCPAASLLQSWTSPQDQKELLPRRALSLQGDLFGLELAALIHIGPAAGKRPVDICPQF